MTIKQRILFLLSLLIYLFAISLFALFPLISLYDWDTIFFGIEYYIAFFIMISFYLMTKSFKVKKIKYLYLLLFFMAYFAQVFGCQFVFDFTIRRLFEYYENHNMTDSFLYDKLFRIRANDAGRNLIVFFGIFYSFILVLIYIVIGKIKRRLKKYERHSGKK